VRVVLLLLLLGALAMLTPSPWAGLWLAIPVVVALALLVSWRFGFWGLAVPLGLAVVVLATGNAETAWAWWVPASGLCGVWMGLREEGMGAGSGARAWMLLPILLFASLLPRLAAYPALTANVEAKMKEGDQQLIVLGREIGYSADRLAALQRSIEDNASIRRRALPQILPTMLFLWIAILVYAGRSLSARTAGALRWPPLARGRLREWRLPDGALWTFLAGLALLLAPWPMWLATGWTLLLNAGIGFCVQGIAVVESWMLARGVPASIIALTLLFVFAVALPVFVLAAAAMGLSDAWLDFRRLEPAAHDSGEENR
jgi:hypothetical protein